MIIGSIEKMEQDQSRWTGYLLYFLSCLGKKIYKVGNKELLLVNLQNFHEKLISRSGNNKRMFYKKMSFESIFLLQIVDIELEKIYILNYTK